MTYSPAGELSESLVIDKCDAGRLAQALVSTGLSEILWTLCLWQLGSSKHSPHSSQSAINEVHVKFTALYLIFKEYLFNRSGNNT